MGYNTALMICNDGMDQLRLDPDAAEKIYQGILSAKSRDGWGESFSIGNHCNPVSIVQSEHADCTQVLLVGGNTIKRVAFIGGYRARIDWTDEGVFHALAKQLGYNVSKAAWRKRADAQGTPTRSAETTGSVGEADGGPVAEPCALTTPAPSSHHNKNRGEGE